MLGTRRGHNYDLLLYDMPFIGCVYCRFYVCIISISLCLKICGI